MILAHRIMCLIVVAAMALLSVLPALAGTVTVTILQRRETSPPCNSPTDIFEVTTLDDSEPHTFFISACVTSVGIVASNNQTNIGNINIQPIPGQLPGTVAIGIAGPGYAGCGGNVMGSSRRGLNFDGLSTSGFTSRLYGGINGDLSGPITVSELCGFEVGGIMRAGIFVGKIAPLDVRPFGATVRAQEIRAVGGAAGRIQIQSTQNAGKLLRVSVGGDVTGSIENFGGPIGDVDIGGNLQGCSIIASGSNGTVLSTIDSIQVVGNIMFSTDNTGSDAPIRARGGIGAIRARSITGNITANANNGTGSIGELTTGWNAASGPFHYTGSLLAAAVGASAGYSDGIHIRGDLLGTMSFGGGGIRRPIIIDGNIPLISNPTTLTNIDSIGALFSSSSDDGRIIIGGSLLGHIFVGHGATAPSLHSQIVIGANALGSAIWTGSVNEDSVTLVSSRPDPDTAPYYARTGASLGGGAVGLLPYHLHAADCLPTSAGQSDPVHLLQTRFCHVLGTFANNVVFTPADFQSIRIRFYGPLLPDDGLPVISRYISGTDWEDVTAAFEQAAVPVDASNANSDKRDVLIYGRRFGYPTDHYGLSRVSSGLYRVTRGSLKCSGELPGVTTRPTVADFEYYFFIDPDCNFDKVVDAAPCSQD